MKTANVTPRPVDPTIQLVRERGLRRDAVQRVLADVFPGATFDQADEVIDLLEKQGYSL